MVKQISLDAWQIQHLADLLEKGSKIVEKTNRPIVLTDKHLKKKRNLMKRLFVRLPKDM